MLAYVGHIDDCSEYADNGFHRDDTLAQETPMPVYQWKKINRLYD